MIFFENIWIWMWRGLEKLVRGVWLFHKLDGEGVNENWKSIFPYWIGEWILLCSFHPIALLFCERCLAADGKGFSV